MSKTDNPPRSHNSFLITKMPASKNFGSDVVSKKMNRLKEYKRAQKEKKLALRATAAAQQIKAKKMSSASAKAVKLSDAESNKAALAPEDTLDIVALRKALELALYEKMETPRQMLIRCDFKAYMDTEFHGKDAEFDYIAPHAVYFDDNGFQATIHTSGSNTQDRLLAHEVELSPLEQIETEKNVALSHPAPQARRCDSRFFEHILSAASAQETVTAKVQDATKCSTGSQPPDSMSTQLPHLMDPAIISHKIKQQIPAKLGILVTNTQTMSKHAEGTGLNNSPSSLTTTLVSTPDSSPTSTHRSSVSSSVGFHARAYTPPTPQLTSATLGYWGHCSYPKPGDIADWSLLDLNSRT
ncbi:hypothetical protein COCC4DRAFT_40254 [Bipolaris maydis ATCC 48331]|uniref:Uncharacterized protein n=2 Tax=Cochliobolus heterostrophus TaxID=5016 RepID=M2U4H5_COCH5|nr:uncharacterized protein COCC4DRAFT_40254 [Bipolaris maydis ATCC 48331]EMD88661.1 hypothetical protein COCHEDRAFT_1032830 [Bipolaris maydis C5]KAJ5028743.1 hypothetical protein J3E73DRAFT_367677 [Bipolaris maydis]ENI05622.1 hypothetical protein COCC4DRAFT_40254 [Bipolaris maydis ATCC 48331]KAJ5063534.1 hypothetical protein J3E74DRAFT_403680 [Bipolaris maydis]KAJ6199793.1 hypothetical protein J3E72DRAFT_372793 [Bipolaris maydis]